MAFREKYLKYKKKYLNLKNQMGGLKTLNELQNPENRQLVDTISESTVTIINAHGGIDIKEWYVIPENTYILTTSEIGGITCNNYNEVFNNLINEKLNRQNLKSMLSKTIEGKTNETKPLNKKNTYKGLYELYEPHDIIPKILLSFHHNENEYSSKDVIYTWLTYSAFQQNNNMSNSLFDSYFQVTPSRPLDIHIKKGALINIGKLKEYLYKIINDYEPNLLNDFIESNNISDEFKNYFNKSSDEYNGRKGIFSLPALYTVKDIEDQKFISMVITLYIKKYTKLDYHIKEVVDTLDTSRVNLIVLTSCLYTKEIYYELLQRFYEKTPKNTLTNRLRTPLYSNQYITYLDKFKILDRVSTNDFKSSYSLISAYDLGDDNELGYSDILRTAVSAREELYAITPQEVPAKLDRIKYLLENRLIILTKYFRFQLGDRVVISETSLIGLVNHILTFNNIDILRTFRLNLNIPMDILLSVLPGITDEQMFIEMLKFKELKNKENSEISAKVCSKLNFLKILINKGYKINCTINDRELAELYINREGIKKIFNPESFNKIQLQLICEYIVRYQIKDEVIKILTDSSNRLPQKDIFNKLLSLGYFNDKIKLGRDIFVNLFYNIYDDPINVESNISNYSFYLTNLQFRDKEEMILEFLRLHKLNKTMYTNLGLDSVTTFSEKKNRQDIEYRINLRS